jgi:hypothetical protein
MSTKHPIINAKQMLCLRIYVNQDHPRNKEDAYISAGYAVATAYQSSQRLFRNEHIKEKIKELDKTIAEFKKNEAKVFVKNVTRISDSNLNKHLDNHEKISTLQKTIADFKKNEWDRDTIINVIQTVITKAIYLSESDVTVYRNANVILSATKQLCEIQGYNSPVLTEHLMHTSADTWKHDLLEEKVVSTQLSKTKVEH